MSNDKSAEEIVRGLRCHAGANCEDCPYWPKDDCGRSITADAADLIESRAAEIAKLRGKLSDEKVVSQSLRNAANGYKAQLSASQQETRAAVEDLDSTGTCHACKHAIDGEPCYCSECDESDRECENCPWAENPCEFCDRGHSSSVGNVYNWQWRGHQPTKEESEK